METLLPKQMTELFTSIWSFLLTRLKTLTSNKKRVLILVTSLLLTLAAIFCVSCGTTRAVVHTSGKGVSTGTITITTNNPTSVEVSPKLDSISIKTRR